jgi:signal peptidase II
MKLFIKKKREDYILYTSIILGCIFLDLLTKFLAYKFLMPSGESVPIIDGVLQLTYVENTGAAFGILKNHRWIFISVSTLAILLIGAFLYLGHAPTRLFAISLSMIAAGGLGNMVDRIGLGYVIDFIDFCLIDFAVFNGADSFVCVGAGLMVLAILVMPNEEKAAKK